MGDMLRDVDQHQAPSSRIIPGGIQYELLREPWATPDPEHLTSTRFFRDWRRFKLTFETTKHYVASLRLLANLSPHLDRQTWHTVRLAGVGRDHGQTGGRKGAASQRWFGPITLSASGIYQDRLGSWTSARASP